MSLIRVFGQKAQMARNPWRRGGYYIRSDLVPWIKQGFQGLSGPQKKAATEFARTAHNCQESDEELGSAGGEIPDVAQCVQNNVRAGQGIHGGMPYKQRVKKQRKEHSVTGAF